MKDLKEPPYLEGLKFENEEIEDARISNRLLAVGIETSRLCNFRCRYCYAESGLPSPNELNLDEIFDMVNQAINLGTRTVRIVGGGETLMYKDIFKIIEQVNEKGAYAIVFTNTSVLGDDDLAMKIHGMPSHEIARKLKEGNTSVIAKINFPIVDQEDPSYEFYSRAQDWINGVKGSYQKMSSGILNLIECDFNEEMPTRLGIESIACELNERALPDLWRWMRRNNIYPYVELVKFAGRARENFGEYELKTWQKARLFHDFLRIDEEEFGYTWKPKPPVTASSCQQNHYSVYIDSQGNVQPCSGLNIYAGNVRQQTLESIIESDAIRAMRRVDECIEGACRNCKEECYGCRGNAYQITGNIYAEDQDCWWKPQKWEFNEAAMRNYLALVARGMPNAEMIAERQLRKIEREYARWLSSRAT